MLYIFRLIITVIYCILVCIFGCIYCLFSPRNPKHVATFGHMFGRLAPLYGLKVECRMPADAQLSIFVTIRTTMTWLPLRISFSRRR